MAYSRVRDLAQMLIGDSTAELRIAFSGDNYIASIR